MGKKNHIYTYILLNYSKQAILFLKQAASPFLLLDAAEA